MKKPELNPGEIYVGRINDEHIILLPGDNGDASWEAQIKWAKSIGGDLPTLIEQAMLWADHRGEFKKGLYWSRETDHDEPGWAWYLRFNNGYLGNYRKGSKLRARAVRRVKVEDLK